MKIKTPALLFILSSLHILGVAQAQTPIIQISGANFRPQPMALVPSNQKELDETLRFDLAATGIVQLLDPKSFLSPTTEGLTADSIQFRRWSDVGAESLVKIQTVSTSSAGPAGGDVQFHLYLFNVVNQKLDFDVTVRSGPGEIRKAAHVLADAVFKHFTHEPGPFVSHLTFVRKSGKNREIYISDWDGKNAQLIIGQGLNLLPALGPLGGVAFTSYRTGKPSLYFQRAGGSPVSLVQGGDMATGVTYSPDGKRIAYALASGESAQIWVASADGSSPKKLTDTPYFINTSPSWSPDGLRLAFVSNRAGSPQIYTMSAEGTGAKRLTFQGEYNQTPDWSPRGDLVAFTARDERGGFDIFTVSVETGKIVRVTQGQGHNEEPTFSPNGRQIIFASGRNGGPHLFVSTLDGTVQLPLPIDKGSYSTPSWGR